MKYKNFVTKLLSLALVLVVLTYYQSVAQVRAAQVADREAAIAEVEAHNREVLREQNAQAAIYQAGTYEGTGMGFGGDITVSVTVNEYEIEAIEVLSHDNEDQAYYDLAVSVVDEVLKAQTTEVDTVSGATFSSVGLLDAIDQALEQAVK